MRNRSLCSVLPLQCGFLATSLRCGHLLRRRPLTLPCEGFAESPYPAGMAAPGSVPTPRCTLWCRQLLVEIIPRRTRRPNHGACQHRCIVCWTGVRGECGFAGTHPICCVAHGCRWHGSGRQSVSTLCCPPRIVRFWRPRRARICTRCGGGRRDTALYKLPSILGNVITLIARQKGLIHAGYWFYSGAASGDRTHDILSHSQAFCR